MKKNYFKSFTIYKMDNQIKKRCAICEKKVGLNYYNCSCDNNKYFCASHRFPFEHNCSNNQMQKNKEILEKQHIKIVPQKISII
jgi:predicted nucleic acid binding AN1-type Zn finger protein